MDELNSTQLVLLALLVSFVTSIATGIVTVTLMDQAPAGVTQTINRVIQKTERVVVPQKDSDQGAQSAQALLAAEEEMIARVITTHAGIVAPLYTQKILQSATSSAQKTATERIGYGVVIHRTGLLVASHEEQSGPLFTSFDGGSSLTPLARRAADAENEALLYAVDATTTPAHFPSSAVPSFADLSRIRVGQAVVAISRTGGELHVRRGIISGVDAPEDDSTAPPALHTSFEGDTVLDNSALFTLEGDLIGVLQYGVSGMRTLSVATIDALIDEATAQQEEDEAESEGE